MFDKDSRHVMSNSLHLHKEFRLNATGRLGLGVRPGGTERVHFVDENNRRLVLASQFEELADKSKNNVKIKFD
jgi:hypothetical protein